MPLESSSVQEYLDQMHEFTTIAAIQVHFLCWSKNAWLACFRHKNGTACNILLTRYARGTRQTSWHGVVPDRHIHETR